MKKGGCWCGDHLHIYRAKGGSAAEGGGSLILILQHKCLPVLAFETIRSKKQTLKMFFVSSTDKMFAGKLGQLPQRPFRPDKLLNFEAWKSDAKKVLSFIDFGRTAAAGCRGWWSEV